MQIFKAFSVLRMLNKDIDLQKLNTYLNMPIFTNIYFIWWVVSLVCQTLDIS